MFVGKIFLEEKKLLEWTRMLNRVSTKRSFLESFLGRFRNDVTQNLDSLSQHANDVTQRTLAMFSIINLVWRHFFNWPQKLFQDFPVA